MPNPGASAGESRGTGGWRTAAVPAAHTVHTSWTRVFTAIHKRPPPGEPKAWTRMALSLTPSLSRWERGPVRPLLAIIQRIRLGGRRTTARKKHGCERKPVFIGVFAGSVFGGAAAREHKKADRGFGKNPTRPGQRIKLWNRSRAAGPSANEQSRNRGRAVSCKDHARRQ